MSAHVAGVVLAAGLSRRMGGRNKLLLEIDGAPMVRHVVQTALTSGLHPVVVVVGHESAGVVRSLDGLPLTFAQNQRPAAGLASSLRVGIETLLPVGGRGEPDAEPAAAVILLGDMPWVRPGQVRALVDAFEPETGCEICVPAHVGRRGNPVLWGRRFFRQIASLEGDMGARALLERHAPSVCEVPVDGDGVLRDVDTPDALVSPR
jgi:molybdenum cofactor cytidylyltransferase